MAASGASNPTTKRFLAIFDHRIKGVSSRTFYLRLSALNAHFTPSAPREEIESDRFPGYLICSVVLINRCSAKRSSLEVNNAGIVAAGGDLSVWIDKSVAGGAGRYNGVECRRGPLARRARATWMRIINNPLRFGTTRTAATVWATPIALFARSAWAPPPVRRTIWPRQSLFRIPLMTVLMHTFRVRFTTLPRPFTPNNNVS